eukprot:TRINITY_DN16855_c0_g1_i1.p1 TRINITY_DN16855_c0_g1~~TRINITY_DN16855_c0_g1_i1.p1  ORF type:complete len:530 (-),score=156.84 TRINITY_DN16855_c0_g1_i1:132-1721(-)
MPADAKKRGRPKADAAEKGEKRSRTTSAASGTRGSKAKAGTAAAASASSTAASAASAASAAAGASAAGTAGASSVAGAATSADAAATPVQRPQPRPGVPVVTAGLGVGSGPALGSNCSSSVVHAAIAAAGGGGAASAAAPAASSAAASAPSGSDRESVPFLRLSAASQPSVPFRGVVYLNKDEIRVGRLPDCEVILESKKVPQMVSRLHARIVRQQGVGAQASTSSWVLHDNRSVNGVLVNDEPVGEPGCVLKHGDVVTFGRKVVPPEFEFVIEIPASACEAPAAQQPTVVTPSIEELLGDQMRRISELQRELEQERDKQREQVESSQRQGAKLTVADLHSELVCCVCQDWLVQPSNIECSHAFCWSCIDTWLLHKRFECPVCRHAVTREPMRCHNLDAIVQKSVEKSGQQEEYAKRVEVAEKAQERAKQLHKELEKSVGEALRKGKAFFQIHSSWSRKEKETFSKGIADYKGDTRSTYCRLTGLTESWVHSANAQKLNMALCNLNLSAFVDKSEKDIRQRLLMFMRYG